MSESPIRIFIGTEPKTNIPLQVLKYSIQKHTKEQLKFQELHGIDWRELRKAPLQSGTGFSLLRWLIPEKCNFEGKAIYLDVDMICFSDIYELWTSTLGNASIGCTYQKDKWFDKAPASSCMLIDCEKAKSQWKYNTQEAIHNLLQIDEKRKKYTRLMHCQDVSPQPLEIDINWNRFNNFVPGTKILHYTIEPKQPWYDPSHAHKDLWRDLFVETLKASLISKQECETEIKRFSPARSCAGCRAIGLHPYWAKFLVHAVN